MSIYAHLPQLVGNESLRQFVDALKVPQAPADAHVAATEVVFQRPALHRAMPVAGFCARQALCLGQIAGRDGTVLLDALEDASQVVVGIVERSERVALPGRPGGTTVIQQGPVAHPHNRGLVCPLLRVFTRAVEIALEARAIVRPEARPDHKEMGRYQDVDEIELQDADGMHGAPVMANIVRLAGARPVEALRSERDATSLCLR